MADATLNIETDALSWASVRAVASDVGPSFYIADVARFEANLHRFLGAFRAIYPRTSVGYSYKTNYLPRFIQSAHALGAYSEVVSQFEYDFARALGIGADRIIYNGPIKRRADLERAFASGALVNADSLPELDQIVEIGRRSQHPISAGVRCYLGENTAGSRFGIDFNAPEARTVLQALDSVPNLRLAGLHCHYSGRGARKFAGAARALIDVHRRILSGRPIDYLDVGGGFASNMSPELASQFAEPPSTPEEYANAVATEMRREYGNGGPELILEPGMGLLADTMVFITRVEAIKRLAGRELAAVNGSIFNIKPLRGSVNLPISVLSEGDGVQRQNGTWDIVGHTCMEVDLLHERYEGAIGIGDFVVVENVGAYANVLNAPFIRGTPSIVERVGDGSWRRLRRESTVRDLLDSYRVVE